MAPGPRSPSGRGEGGTSRWVFRKQPPSRGPGSCFENQHAEPGRVQRGQWASPRGAPGKGRLAQRLKINQRSDTERHGVASIDAEKWGPSPRSFPVHPPLCSRDQAGPGCGSPRQRHVRVSPPRWNTRGNPQPRRPRDAGQSRARGPSGEAGRAPPLVAAAALGGNAEEPTGGQNGRGAGPNPTDTPLPATVAAGGGGARGSQRPACTPGPAAPRAQVGSEGRLRGNRVPPGR